MKIVGALLLAFLLAAAGCAHSLAASGVAFRVESNVPDASVWIDDAPYTNFDADALQVTLPETDQRLRVKVRLEPVVAPHTNGVVKHAP